MNQLYLTILFPLIGFLILVSARKRLSENVAAFVGVGSVGLAALVAPSILLRRVYNAPKQIG